MNKESWKRWALFLAAFPIAVVVNIIRLSGTAVLASRWGGDVAKGFLHDFSGWVVFVAGIALLLLVQNALGRVGKGGGTGKWLKSNKRTVHGAGCTGKKNARCKA
jgi:exosortase/archaeosortase family protein